LADKKEKRSRTGFKCCPNGEKITKKKKKKNNGYLVYHVLFKYRVFEVKYEKNIYL